MLNVIHVHPKFVLCDNPEELEGAFGICFNHVEGFKPICWPILHQKGRQILVKTPGGEIWLPVTGITKPQEKESPQGMACVYCVEIEGTGVNLERNIESFLIKLENLMYDPWIEVKGAGKGPTEKSAKFKLPVLKKYYHPYARHAEDFTWQQKSKTLTLPLSLAKHESGQLYFSASILKKKLKDDEKLVKGSAFNLEPIKMEIMRIADPLIEEQKERLAVRKAEEQARLMKVREARERREAERLEAARLAPPKPLATTKPIKTPDKVLENVMVNWVDWGGTSKKRIKIEQSAENCTVRFFGSKRIIILPDGEEITKMQGPNLVILGEV